MAGSGSGRDALFLAFLVAQATAMFGGHDYLRQTTGLTYAEYVHEGFGQFTVATMLTLTVVAWAARKATPGRRRDLALEALCGMTIVVVVSALYRMHLYEEAFGFTRRRGPHRRGEHGGAPACAASATA